MSRFRSIFAFLTVMCAVGLAIPTTVQASSFGPESHERRSVGGAAAGTAGDYESQLFTGVTPARLMDTRASGTTVDGVSANGGAFIGVRSVQVTGRGGIPSTGVGAVAVNITVTNSKSAGYATVFPTGTSRPTASNLNFLGGATVANAVVTKLSP
ncbi:MAG TPA: hypothetical protein VL068_09665, partial [Microthrixaceae bacterium]|nr:hypothetical protein [Microthrixaceae bacterium]